MASHGNHRVKGAELEASKWKGSKVMAGVCANGGEVYWWSDAPVL
jgi:hypothetical protein